MFVPEHIPPEEKLALYYETLWKEQQREKRNKRVDADCPFWTSFGGYHHVCRRCPSCLRKRQGQWAVRCLHEFGSAPRSWWCTFTYRGEAAICYRELQLAFKRLRKAGRKIRYLTSEEAGELNGRKHFHVILHGPADLTKREVEALWPHGFTKVRLARSARVGAYLAKYLAKSSRIRASARYGVGELCAARAGYGAHLDAFIRTGDSAFADLLELRGFGLRVSPLIYGAIPV